MNTTDRFKTAAEYVEAHVWAPQIDQDTREALESILVKGKGGIWSVRRTAPRDPAARCAWEAYRDVSHAVRWGALPSHRAHSKVWFFMTHGDQVDRYDRLFDSFLALAKIQRETCK